MLPRLLERRSPLAASLILGVWWGVWHAPAFWGFGGGKEGGAIMFLLFTVYTIVLAVLFTAIWLRSGGNLLICAVFHASLNATENWVKAMLPGVAEEAAPTFIFAGVCLGHGSRNRLGMGTSSEVDRDGLRHSCHARRALTQKRKTARGLTFLTAARRSRQLTLPWSANKAPFDDGHRPRHEVNPFTEPSSSPVKSTVLSE